jgi:predicted transcriptional regulator
VDTKTTGRVALLSIHPQYADRILAGEKKVEFRRRRLADDIRLVIIYATEPVSAVVGWFEVGATIRASPSTLWERYRRVSGIKRAAYREYFFGRRFGFGIEVTRAGRLDPTPLSQFRSTVRPPQFVKYLTREDAQDVLAKAAAPAGAST